jgi:hypothetical protein
VPPARGRRSLELRDDGSAVERGPGPDDRPVESSASWELRDDDLVLRGERGLEVMRIVSAEEDRLVLRPEAL